MKRPYNTLFLIESLDGKISTGDVDERDVDKDYKIIDGIKDGVHQYYEIEKQTDPFSLNSGKVMAKIGVNVRTEEPKKMGASFIIIDNKPHLTASGVKYLSKWVKKLYLVTTNNNHTAYKAVGLNNIEIISYDKVIDLKDLMNKRAVDYKIEPILQHDWKSIFRAAWL